MWIADSSLLCCIEQTFLVQSQTIYWSIIFKRTDVNHLLTTARQPQQSLCLGKNYWSENYFNSVLPRVHETLKHTLKILQQMMPDFQRVFGHVVGTSRYRVKFFVMLHMTGKRFRIECFVFRSRIFSRVLLVTYKSYASTF